MIIWDVFNGFYFSIVFFQHFVLLHFNEKKKPKKISDGDAKKEIATKIKKWLREQDTGSNKINRDDFKTIAKKCTEKMWKIYQTKRKQKAGLMPKDFLSKRRSGKVIALINKYIEQSKKRNAWDNHPSIPTFSWKHIQSSPKDFCFQNFSLSPFCFHINSE